MKGIEGNVEILRGHIETLKSVCEIQNALDMQEYFDKERIALYGFPYGTGQGEESVSSTKEEGYQTHGKGIIMPSGGLGLSLVTNCLSCSGQQNVRMIVNSSVDLESLQDGVSILQGELNSLRRQTSRAQRSSPEKVQARYASIACVCLRRNSRELEDPIAGGARSNPKKALSHHQGLALKFLEEAASS